jgi:Flp pilus assembly pilin Flp
MMMKTSNLLNVARQFNNDEDGIEALQVVMIVAIAAIVLIAVMTVGQEVMTWAKEKKDELLGKSIS